MSRKIVVVNAGPRKGWNTDTLIREAAAGAEEAGAVIERFDLFDLEPYTGCVSCFSCKTNAHKGHCVKQDALTTVLDAIRGADGLIIGSPMYLSQPTASFRALYERLVFQSLTYNNETPCCRLGTAPVLMIMTCGAPEYFYVDLVKEFGQMLTAFVGPTETFLSADTLQLADYSKTDWEWSSDPEAKYSRHETVFPQHRAQVHEMGAALARG